MTTLHDRLRAAHRDIEETTAAVAASIRDGDVDVMRYDFAVLERKLLEHMSWEEMYILPPYARQMPESAARLRAEHAELRARLGEIGLAIDLHAVRAAAFDELVERLRAHAACEDVMYETFADDLPDEAEKAITSRYERVVGLLKSLPRIL